eukprot:scaffold6643_cov114-Skeletonema_dohrnii-CCMP3373.AAC.7
MVMVGQFRGLRLSPLNLPATSYLQLHDAWELILDISLLYRGQSSLYHPPPAAYKELAITPNARRRGRGCRLPLMPAGRIRVPWLSVGHECGVSLLPPKVQQKSKEQKMAAAMAGGKGKKKKWSKGKSRDKVDNKVLFTKEQYDRLNSEVPKMKLITVSSVVEKLKISGGLARRALMQLAEEGAIRPVCVSRAQRIYTRNIGEDEEE